ncbi:MAG: metalloregulator ArsR/SmtB family transcription factor [Actinomycetota bacterium]|nr:metalloregulator ArsR/SmtB family transcription factor [Actinomycetota bacterium]
MSHGPEGVPPPARIDAQTAGAIAETMHALAAPSRVRILACLKDAPASVTLLAENVEMEASAVSHQLRVLRHLGLVVRARQGRNVIYALHDDHVATLLDHAAYHVDHLRLGDTAPPRETRSA